MFNAWFPQNMTTLRKLIWLRKINGGGGSSDPLNTFTGAIVRFLAKKAKPIVKLEANFTPIQNLNGYDNPWPAGGGKNIAYLEQGSLKFANDGSEVVSTTRVRTGFIPVELAVYYVASSQNNGWVIKNGCAYDSEKNYLGYGVVYPQPSNGLFNTDMITDPWVQNIKYVRFIYGNADNTDCTPSDYWYQFERGTTPTSYAPYSNICPISGHTGCEVQRTGKNLLDPNYRTNLNKNVRYYYGSTGILLKANTAYTFSLSTASAQNQILEIGGSQLTVNYGKDSLTYTPTRDVYVLIDVYFAGNFPAPSGGTAAVNCQLEVGSTASDYEPYSGTTVSISFGQTVYGGTLTINEDGTGTVTATHCGELFDGSSDENWIKYGSGSAQAYAMKIAPSNSAVIVGNEVTINSSYLKPVTPDSTWGNNDNFISFSTAFSTIVTGIRTITTVEDWKQYLSSNPLQVVYELSTPLTFTVTASQINTLVGENNVWVNAATGDITVQAYGSPIT